MSGLLIRGGKLFDPGSGLDGVGDVLIAGGHIVAVGKVDAGGEVEAIEAGGLLVLPGLMDMHVHLREPGQEQKETIASGTRAAAAGGFTAVVCEPNTSPPRDTAERIAEVVEIAGRRAAVRVLPKCAITMGQQGREVTDLAALHMAGAAAASDDGLAVADGAVMRRAMAAAKAAAIPLTLHVDGPEMMARDIALAAEMGYPVHFSHVSLAEEVELIARAQARGLRASGEATPHHLSLCVEEAPRDDPNFKMNPPLRSARDRAALRAGLRQGVIAVIASDHAPHTPAERQVAHEQTPAGVIGLETTIGVIWTDLIHGNLLEVATAVRAMTVGPAAVLNLEAPSLRVGARADVTLLDPQAEWVVEPERFQSLARNCPFAGRRLRGRAAATIVGGKVVRCCRAGMPMPAAGGGEAR